MAWRDASIKAAGGKVLDDPNLLRRHTAKEAKAKAKRAKAWQERTEKVREDLRLTQEK